MSNKCIVYLRREESFPFCDATYIGVDSGAYYLASCGIPMKYAIGDFDSIQKEDFQIIQQYAEKVITLPIKKDDSDSEYAIRFLVKEGYDEIVLYGGLGDRVDHMYVNLQLCYQFPNIVTFQNAKNRICALGKGKYSFSKEEGYVSFFAQENAVITLSGFLYPLEKQVINASTLFTLSNQIVSQEATVTIHEGIVLVMRTRD